MREPQKEGRGPCTRGERGGARLNFLIVVALLGLLAYAAYNYVPVAYSAFLYKDFMQETVDKAAFPPGQTVGWAEAQLRAKAEELELPEDTVYTVQKENGRVVARVHWTRPIPLPGFIYDYEFDYTAKSTGFISQR